MTLAEKREALKALVDELKRAGASVLPARALATVRSLADDENWEVRQDVAEMLLYVPEADFAALAGKLMADQNGYVRRSAARSRERRRAAELGARRASRGVEQVSEQYESLLKEVGGEAARKAIGLGDKRFALLANEMIHDHLNILAPLKSQVQALKKRLASDRGVRRKLATDLADGIDFMERCVRDLEAYVQESPCEWHPEWLGEVIRQAVDLARKNLEGDGLDLRAVVVDDSGVAEARLSISRQLMVQAFTNVLKNAFESLPRRRGRSVCGRIIVSARANAGEMVIQIKDNGGGMSEEELAKLRAFLPGRKNLNKKRSTGYGLLIAKKNVEAHDGRVDIESRLGHGTTVTIVLPVGGGHEPDGESAGC